MHIILFISFVAVVVQQPTPSTGQKFRDLPVVMTDSSGNAYTTELRYVNGLLMWVAVGITCFVAGQSLTTYTCIFLAELLVHVIKARNSCLLQCFIIHVNLVIILYMYICNSCLFMGLFAFLFY